MGFVLRLLPLLLFLGWIAVWLWCLSEILSTPREAWDQIGESKTVWTLVVLVLQFFGTLFYLASVRPKLKTR